MSGDDRGPGSSRLAHTLAFFQGFLRRPQQVASIIPSSRALERRIVESGRICEAKVIVELGPGTGGTTRALLEALPEDGSLLAIEINPGFVGILEAIGDRRLVVFHGSALDIGTALTTHGLPAPDVVVSGIPFSTMTSQQGLAIVEAVEGVLAPGGKFVAYQVRDRVETLGRKVFGEPISALEPLNVPPMRVYCWTKG